MTLSAIAGQVMASCAVLLLGSVLACPIAAAAPAPREPLRSAPAPDCLDARNLREMLQTDPDSVTVLDAHAQPWRIRFQAPCPGVSDAAQAVLEAPAGWACGGKGEQVQVDGRRCPIASVARISERAFAQQARDSDAYAINTLATVQVAASETRGRFRGSPSYCFAARHLRSWSEDPNGVVVEMNPRRAGGNRFYRVELGTRCPEIGSSPEISFQSGFGNGLICGNYGDRLVASQDIPGDLRRMSNPRHYLGCPVTAVYPIR
ncbi:hypothetical protein KQ945_03600 [Bacillus subtilis subsp. subtilis]|nr:hypothetical protein [Bacillus subtilis subsp. subtilis]